MIVKVYDQSCIAIPKSPLVAGTAEKHTAEFQFTNNWDGLEKIAVFEASEGIRRVMEIIDNKCDVPWEMLSRPGFLKVGVIGVHEDTRLPTIWSPPMRIIPGAVSTHSPSGGYSKSFLEATLEACRAILAKVNEGALDVGVALQECREILDRILGAIYTPHISDEGILSWTNTAGLPNPDPVKIVGEGVPVGGTSGQVLIKNSNTDYDTMWANMPSGAMVVRLTGQDEDFASLVADHTPREVYEAVIADTPVFFYVIDENQTPGAEEFVHYIFPVGNVSYDQDTNIYSVSAPIVTPSGSFDGFTHISSGVLYGFEGSADPEDDGWTIEWSQSVSLQEPEYDGPLTAGYVPMTVEDSPSWVNWQLVNIGDQLLPAGGTSGQVLAKDSNTDHDVHWVNPPSGAMFVTLTQSTAPAETESVISEVTIPAADWTYDSESGTYYATVSADSLLDDYDESYAFDVTMDGVQYSELGRDIEQMDNIGDFSLSDYPFYIFTRTGDNDALLADIMVASPGSHTFSVVAYASEEEETEIEWTADHTIAEIADAYQSKTPVYIGVPIEGGPDDQLIYVPVTEATHIEEEGVYDEAYCVGFQVRYIADSGNSSEISYTMAYGYYNNMDGEAWDVSIGNTVYALPNPSLNETPDGYVMATNSGQWVPVPISDIVPSGDSALYVHLTKDQYDVWSADKTVQEIVEANAGGTPVVLYGDFADFGIDFFALLATAVNSGGMYAVGASISGGRSTIGGGQTAMAVYNIGGSNIGQGDSWTVEEDDFIVFPDPANIDNPMSDGTIMQVQYGAWEAVTPSFANTSAVPASASVSNGVVTFKNSANTTLFTFTLPVYNGGVS